ncbi:MAG TPA: hypothetical protein VEV43_13505 [Actinomycetota bacterium]|nr:hypothetical protein [Actinomycetota bacterium]
MDEARLREDAEAHGSATVAGDLKTAGSYLDKEAYGPAGQVMEKMPKPLEGSEVGSVEVEGDAALVQIRYSGGGDEVVIESRWAERDGTPKIVGLRVL